MSSKVHVISKNGTFLFRFNDGEFGSKWCGVWKKDTKYFDYFSFKINETALSSVNVQKMEFYNSQFCKLYYQTNEGAVSEEVVCIDDAVIITIKPEFGAKVLTEVGVNIRNRSENYSEAKRYEVAEDGKKVGISISDKSAYIIYDKGAFKKGEYYGIHVPGRYARDKGFSSYFDECATQNKYVPGIIESTLEANEELNIILSTKAIDSETAYKIVKNRMHSVMEYDFILNKTFKNFDLGETVDGALLKDSIDALYSYANFTEKDFYGGYPYFNQFWLRDALLILPSFLSLNNPNFVKNSLERISGMLSDSGLPSIPGSSLFPTDVPALFIICLYNYFQWTGDLSMLKLLGKTLKALLNFGRKFFDRGFVHDGGRSSWMDSMDREYSIEIQALWIRAFESGAEICSLIGEESSDLRNIASLITSNISKYKRGEYFSDQLYKNINSANQLFLVFYGITNAVDNKFILDNAEKTLLGEYGVYSVSEKDPSYDFSGYQNGSIWPLLTNVLAASAFKNGEYPLGKKCIDILSKNLGSQCESRINEIFQPDGVPQGCPSQAWSICMLPYIIDRFLLGIDINAAENEIFVAIPDKTIKAKRTFFINESEITIELANGAITSNKEVIDEGGRFKILI